MSKKDSQDNTLYEIELIRQQAYAEGFQEGQEDGVRMGRLEHKFILEDLKKKYRAEGFQEAVKKIKELEVKKFPYGERPWCTECIRRIRKALKPTQSQGSEGEKRLTKKEKKIIGWKKYLKKKRPVK